MTALPVLQARTCGDCDACCVIFDILDKGFEKKADERCRHLGPGGCMTYDTRPVSCRSFACLWLKGAGGEEHRPDLCGFVMREIEHPAQPGVALVQVFELVDGALAAGSEGEAAAHEVGYQYPTLMVRRDGTRRAIQPTGGILAPVVLDGKTP